MSKSLSNILASFVSKFLPKKDTKKTAKKATKKASYNKNESKKYSNPVASREQMLEIIQDHHSPVTFERMVKLLKYKDEDIVVDLTLCDECNSLSSKAIKHLQECPHEQKPRCRKCPNPCYEKT